MLKKPAFFGTLTGAGFLLGVMLWAVALQFPQWVIAAEPAINHPDGHTAPQPQLFQRIEQPLGNKVAITLGGLGLIGLEVWWFLLSKPKSRRATAQSTIQEVTVTVDGGYEPSQIVVQVGQLVRLTFDRKDSSRCLEEVRFPDFHITQTLPLNQMTAIEFTPKKPGKYEFTCGMNLCRGVVDVRP